jgi:hypothetical protein
LYNYAYISLKERQAGECDLAEGYITSNSSYLEFLDSGYMITVDEETDYIIMSVILYSSYLRLIVSS